MKLIVGVSDMKLSTQEDDTIVTFALGSCIGVAIYDPIAIVGGILHYMLPKANLTPDRSLTTPYMFGDIGIPKFFREAYRLGAYKPRMRTVIVGGAGILDIQDQFNIGEKNIDIAHKLFSKNGIPINSEDTGGAISRTLYLDMASGDIWYTTSGKKILL